MRFLTSVSSNYNNIVQLRISCSCDVGVNVNVLLHMRFATARSCRSDGRCRRYRTTRYSRLSRTTWKSRLPRSVQSTCYTSLFTKSLQRHSSCHRYKIWLAILHML